MPQVTHMPELCACITINTENFTFKYYILDIVKSEVAWPAQPILSSSQGKARGRERDWV